MIAGFEDISGSWGYQALIVPSEDADTTGKVDRESEDQINMSHSTYVYGCNYRVGYHLSNLNESVLIGETKLTASKVSGSGPKEAERT